MRYTGPGHRRKISIVHTCALTQLGDLASLTEQFVQIGRSRLAHTPNSVQSFTPNNFAK